MFLGLKLYVTCREAAFLPISSFKNKQTTSCHGRVHSSAEDQWGRNCLALLFFSRKPLKVERVEVTFLVSRTNQLTMLKVDFWILTCLEAINHSSWFKQGWITSGTIAPEGRAARGTDSELPFKKVEDVTVSLSLSLFCSASSSTATTCCSDSPWTCSHFLTPQNLSPGYLFEICLI